MLQGVVLLLFQDKDQKKVWTVREQRDKAVNGKRAGMTSIPMETMEPGETKENALLRLLIEEVGVGLVDLPLEIGEVYFPATATTAAYRLHCYAGVIADPHDTPQPSDLDDVRPNGWLDLEQLDKLGQAGRRELPAIGALLRRWVAKGEAR